MSTPPAVASAHVVAMPLQRAFFVVCLSVGAFEVGTAAPDLLFLTGALGFALAGFAGEAALLLSVAPVKHNDPVPTLLLVFALAAVVGMPIGFFTRAV